MSTKLNPYLGFRDTAKQAMSSTSPSSAAS